VFDEAAAAAAESIRSREGCLLPEDAFAYELRIYESYDLEAAWCEWTLLLYRVAALGDTVGVRSRALEIERQFIQGGRIPLGPSLVLALLESLDSQAVGTPALDTLEARARLGAWADPPASLALLMVARLWRYHEDYERALAAVRSLRKNNLVDQETYRPAFLKEEGDLAVMVGDTAGAIQAYTHYLTLRTDPDSGAVQEEADQVRTALARLVER